MKLYEEDIDSKEMIDFVKKNLYDSLTIFCEMIVKNEKNISKEMKILLNIAKIGVSKNISDMKINGINEENMDNCYDFVNTFLKIGLDCSL